MKPLLLLTMVVLTACDRITHGQSVNDRLDSLSIVLDTMNAQSSRTLHELRETNRYLDLAAPHQEKSIGYLKKYYATYNDRYLRLYNLHNDSFRYYLNKSIGK